MVGTHTWLYSEPAAPHGGGMVCVDKKPLFLCIYCPIANHGGG